MRRRFTSGRKPCRYRQWRSRARQTGQLGSRVEAYRASVERVQVDIRGKRRGMRAKELRHPAEVNGGGRFFGGDDAEHRDWIGNVVGMVEEEEMMDGLDNKQVKAEEMRKGLECAEGWSNKKK
ncbi:hypothetical protein BDEG_21233 [Batrachochytrium dendrobatidis JEL423]|uniref:Uncharacterized protein n=1 Tax=Batrachochytrium dendrobatidis (strain JEL423) TaxID=403673 RepID=A0A177WC44_BATDL|nr:hypothetical protein BDEG_21233 [Batrachochytrium dendrobatidis JEL423]